MVGRTQRLLFPWLGGGIVLVALAVLVRVALGVWGSTAPTVAGNRTETGQATADGQTRTNEGGQVTVSVTWQGSAADPRFTVVLDTHAVDLDGYDLRQLAVLRTEDGREVQPLTWDAPRGGHHREGTLVFPSTTPEGTPLLSSSTRTIELIIRDIAEVPERSFRWTL
jgi:hypothetical protein